jgi:prophage muMc02, nuclease
MKLLRTAILFAATIAASANAYEINGKVVGITDGDTVVILDGTKTQHKVRLSDIDAPESKQPYGTKARQQLSDFVFGKEVTADCREKDKYGRDLCTIRIGDLDVNAEMVNAGAAWVYTKYNTREELPALQEAAKGAKRGLWSLPESQTVEPEQWRRGEREQKQLSQSQTKPKKWKASDNNAAAEGFSCGKRTCKEMSSCAEARFHLTQCGMRRLDRDNDGIPCESICR